MLPVLVLYHYYRSYVHLIVSNCWAFLCVAVYKCYVIQSSSPYSQLFNSLTLNAQLGTPQHLMASVWQVQNVLQKEDHQLEIVPLDLGFAVWYKFQHVGLQSQQIHPTSGIQAILVHTLLQMRGHALTPSTRPMMM